MMRFLFAAVLMLTASYGLDAAAAIEGMAKPWQLNFQPAASPVMENLIGLHNLLLVIITVITLFVVGLIGYVCIRFNSKSNPVPSKNTHNTTIEILWTVIPILILIVIAIPSFRIFFGCVHSIGCADDGKPVAPDLTLKVVGYQWYWNFEYPDQHIQFDSYMKKTEDLKEGEPRLLTVDNPIYVPVHANVRVLTTGGDVIHAFAMPAFGVKQDAVPGRLNETWFRADKEGTYFGQCSELCGRLHGFMPIQIEVVSKEKFDEWVEEAKKRFSSDGSSEPLHAELQQ